MVLFNRHYRGQWHFPCHWHYTVVGTELPWREGQSRQAISAALVRTGQLERVPVVPSDLTGTIEGSGAIQATGTSWNRATMESSSRGKIFQRHYRGQWHCSGHRHRLKQGSYTKRVLSCHAISAAIWGTDSGTSQATGTSWNRATVESSSRGKRFQRHYIGQWHSSIGTIEGSGTCQAMGTIQ